MRRVAAALLVVAAAACGKKGNPLPPIRPLPNRVGDLSAVRADNRVDLSFTVPANNTDNSTPAAIDRVDIYSVDTPADAEVPTAEKIAVRKNLRHQISIRHPPPPEESNHASNGANGGKDASGKGDKTNDKTSKTNKADENPAAPADTRPAPGDHTSVTETISGADVPYGMVRRYVAVGVSGSGRGHPGPFSSVVSVPLTTTPDAPIAVTATYDEHTLTLGWVPPIFDTGDVMEIEIDNGSDSDVVTEEVPIPDTTSQSTTSAGATTGSPQGAEASGTSNAADAEPTAAGPPSPPGAAPANAPAVPEAGTPTPSTPAAGSAPATAPEASTSTVPSSGSTTATPPGDATSTTPPGGSAAGVADASTSAGASSPTSPTGQTAATRARQQPAAPGVRIFASDGTVFDPDHAKLLTDGPVSGRTYAMPVEFGRAQCFAMRTVVASGTVSLESPWSPSTCVAPVDTYPPAAPGLLQAIQQGSAIVLIWSAVDAPDLAGYIVLRSDNGGDSLVPITRAPIPDTTYTDANVQPGMTYVYAVIALDKVGNPSEQSNRPTVVLR